MKAYRVVSEIDEAIVLEPIEDFNILDSKGDIVITPNDGEGCWMDAVRVKVDPFPNIDKMRVS